MTKEFGMTDLDEFLKGRSEILSRLENVRNERRRLDLECSRLHYELEHYDLVATPDLNRDWKARKEIADVQQHNRVSGVDISQQASSSTALPCMDDLDHAVICSEQPERISSNRSRSRRPLSVHNHSARGQGNKQIEKRFTGNQSTRSKRIVSPTTHDLQALLESEMVIDIDNNPTLEARLDSVPCLILSRNGVYKHPTAGLRDTASMINAMSESLFKEVKEYVELDNSPLKPVRPFGKARYKVTPLKSCWARLYFPEAHRVFRIQFSVFNDNEMHEHECIFSVKTCLKAYLIIDGLNLQG